MDAGGPPSAPGVVAMTPTRRAVLIGSALGAAGLGVAGCAGQGQTGELIRSRARLPGFFSVTLPIPPVLAPVGSAGGEDRYRVEARVADLEILPGTTTQVLGYEGLFPGPTIETRRGRPVAIEHVNSLPVPMAVHLHGGVVEAAHDGFPTDLVLPRDRAAPRRTGPHTGHGGVTDPDAVVTTGRRTYRYGNDQRAAMLWYHDHRMDFTGPMVYAGLSGLHIVRDDDEDALGLPGGDRELPLVIADRAFTDDAQFDYPALDPSMTTTPGVEDFAMEGVLGDVVLVNGAPWPVAEVDAARYRLRLLNASNARRYALALDPPPPEGPAFTQVGSDVGLLASPVTHDSIPIAPAERYDVVVDFGAYPVGTRVVLRNTMGSGGTGTVMAFDVVRTARDDSRVPDVLAVSEPLRRSDSVATREFTFTRGGATGDAHWVINGLPFDPTRMDAVVRPGTVEVWRFGTDVHHPVHVHLGHFQVLSRGGHAPLPADVGWKDTVDVRPAEHVDVAIAFPEGYTGRYVMHCHNLEHEDMMMMSAFEVR